MSENHNFDPSANTQQPHNPERVDSLLSVVDAKLTGAEQWDDGTTSREFFGEFDLGGFSDNEQRMFFQPAGGEIEGNPAIFTVRRIPVESTAFDGNVAEIKVRPAFPGGYHMLGSRKREIAFTVAQTDGAPVIIEDLPSTGTVQLMEQIALQYPELIDDDGDDWVDRIHDMAKRMIEANQEKERELGMSGVINDERALYLITSLRESVKPPRRDP